MPTDEFKSLFDEEPVDNKKREEVDDLFTFDDQPQPFDAPRPTPPSSVIKKPAVPDRQQPQHKKRTSEDFQPDMDALAITAQSPMIIEGIKCLASKEFAANTVQIYTESLKGVEVFIKILERNPNNYYKLSPVINSDVDCKEIEAVAFRLYSTKFGEKPETDSHILKAYEMLRNRLKIGYNKALVSTSMLTIKKYYLLSGTLDQEKISQMVKNNSKELKTDVIKFIQHLKIAIQLIKIGDFEISKGLKGRVINTFVIRTSQLLALYYLVIGDAKSEKYYRRIYENYKKYFIVRD